MLNSMMKVAVVLLLAGCSGPWQTDYEAPQDPAVTRSWHVHDVAVTVPDELTTTEENSFAPNADIVWHGEPFGDRRAQVAAIVENGIEIGSSGLRGQRGVNILVTLQEFHAVTPKARAQAPSAVHNIAFVMQVVDQRTGEPLTEPELIRADLEAFVGEEAIFAALEGQTQTVRITDHLADVTRGWLGIGPDPRRVFESTGR